jgi:hypothetical protein
MSKKAEAGSRRNDSGAPRAQGSVPLRGVRREALPWILAGAGIILLAGCGSTQHEETPPSVAAEANITPPQTRETAVQTAPINEILNETKQFIESKRGKKVLIGAGGAIFVMIALLIFFRVVRGNPAARLRTPDRDEDSRSASLRDPDSRASATNPSQHSSL